MKPSPYFWWGLLAFFLVSLGIWLGFIQEVGEWLFRVVTVGTPTK